MVNRQANDKINIIIIKQTPTICTNLHHHPPLPNLNQPQPTSTNHTDQHPTSPNLTGVKQQPLSEPSIAQFNPIKSHITQTNHLINIELLLKL